MITLGLADRILNLYPLIYGAASMAVKNAGLNALHKPINDVEAIDGRLYLQTDVDL